MEPTLPELQPLASLDVAGPVQQLLVSPLGVPIVVTPQQLFVLERSADGGLLVKHAIQCQQAGTAAALSGKGSELIAGGADGFLKWHHVVSGEESCATQFPWNNNGGNGAVSLAITAVAAAKGSNLVAASSGR